MMDAFGNHAYQLARTRERYIRKGMVVFFISADNKSAYFHASKLCPKASCFQENKTQRTTLRVNTTWQLYGHNP